MYGTGRGTEHDVMQAGSPIRCSLAKRMPGPGQFQAWGFSVLLLGRLSACPAKGPGCMLACQQGPTAPSFGEPREFICTGERAAGASERYRIVRQLSSGQTSRKINVQQCKYKMVRLVLVAHEQAGGRLALLRRWVRCLRRICRWRRHAGRAGLGTRAPASH